MLENRAYVVVILSSNAYVSNTLYKIACTYLIDRRADLVVSEYEQLAGSHRLLNYVELLPPTGAGNQSYTPDYSRGT